MTDTPNVPSAEDALDEILRGLTGLAVSRDDKAGLFFNEPNIRAALNAIEADRERIRAAERERCMDEIDHCGCLDAATHRLRRAPGQREER